MECPRCKVPMRTVTVDGLEIDLCPVCEGTWYDAGELSRTFRTPEVRLSHLRSCLAENEAGSASEVDLEQPVNCPRCGEEMRRGRYLADCPVLVDKCDEHGVWLDDGELGQLLDHLESQVEAPAEGQGFLGMLRRMFR